MSYSLKNGKKYTINFEHNAIKVTELTEFFNGLFESETDIVYLDNMREVREYLKERNDGEEVW